MKYTSDRTVDTCNGHGSAFSAYIKKCFVKATLFKFWRKMLFSQNIYLKLAESLTALYVLAFSIERDTGDKSL